MWISVEFPQHYYVSLFSLFPREQYVDAYIDYRFHKSVDNSFKPFFMGFHRVCGGDVLVRVQIKIH